MKLSGLKNLRVSLPEGKGEYLEKKILYSTLPEKYKPQ